MLLVFFMSLDSKHPISLWALVEAPTTTFNLLLVVVFIKSFFSNDNALLWNYAITIKIVHMKTTRVKPVLQYSKTLGGSRWKFWENSY